MARFGPGPSFGPAPSGKPGKPKKKGRIKPAVWSETAPVKPGPEAEHVIRGVPAKSRLDDVDFWDAEVVSAIEAERQRDKERAEIEALRAQQAAEKKAKRLAKLQEFLRRRREEAQE